MFLVKDVAALRAYIEVRRTMAKLDDDLYGNPGAYARGSVFAFEEVLKAIDGLIEFQKEENTNVKD